MKPPGVEPGGFEKASNAMLNASAFALNAQEKCEPVGSHSVTRHRSSRGLPWRKVQNGRHASEPFRRLARLGRRRKAFACLLLDELEDFAAEHGQRSIHVRDLRWVAPDVSRERALEGPMADLQDAGLVAVVGCEIHLTGISDGSQMDLRSTPDTESLEKIPTQELRVKREIKSVCGVKDLKPIAREALADGYPAANDPAGSPTHTHTQHDFSKPTDTEHARPPSELSAHAVAAAFRKAALDAGKRPFDFLAQDKASAASVASAVSQRAAQTNKDPGKLLESILGAFMAAKSKCPKPRFEWLAERLEDYMKDKAPQEQDRLASEHRRINAAIEQAQQNGQFDRLDGLRAQRDEIVAQRRAKVGVVKRQPVERAAEPEPLAEYAGNLERIIAQVQGVAS